MQYASNLRFQPSEDAPAYLRVRDDDALRLHQTPLFMQMVGGSFVQYKPAGRRLGPSVRGTADLPRRLYIRKDDKELAVQDIQVALLDGTMRDMIKSGDQAQVKLLVVSLFEETLLEPRIACLAGFKGLVDIFVREYSADERMLRAFYLVAGEGYSLAEHSINIMALVMGYGIRKKLPRKKIEELALAALLHDVGKADLPTSLRQPTHMLSEAEFALYRQHPLNGLKYAPEAEFGPAVAEAVLRHHERTDGSGYPKGSRQVGLSGQIVGLADSYDNLTNQQPASRHRLAPLETLSLLLQESRKGKFDEVVLQGFAYSLTK
ncbi:MAG: HD domain-containing phosphohydrolase [Pseudomonadota bacterium]